MLIFFYLLVIEQLAQGLHGLWQGRGWLRMTRRRAALAAGFYAPRVALICPVKGMEPGLEENLAALAAFDYPDYEIFFALASEADPALKMIERLQPASRHKVHIVIAGRPEGCGEKVNNLRAAVQRAGEGFGVFVFTDSDGHAGPAWLARMVAPLADEHLGAVTTFRWYFSRHGGPAGGRLSGGSRLWSALASAWNAPIATYLGEHAHNFCWGGGTAIRCEQFERAGVLQEWNGSVSDDWSLTRALRWTGLPIRFAPQCLVPDLWDCTARELLEFTNRQIVITRVYQPKLWALSGMAHLLYCGALLTGAGLFLANWLTGAPAAQLLPAMAALVVLCMARGALRLAAMLELLPEWKCRLLADAWIWTLLAPAVPFLALWNCCVALFSRRIQWRGIVYELRSPADTRILSS